MSRKKCSSPGCFVLSLLLCTSRFYVFPFTLTVVPYFRSVKRKVRPNQLTFGTEN
eukprot:TRINITY_DN2324_c0_g1_i1.p1 TRINITY_DN2324_c0_g1~~TRINITY_DN2324_c0_g1_i1.p1  ORF type:complete len:55 (-),score=7.70 TRINITY_DN2324_c0_g1_i1:164-328(-)